MDNTTNNANGPPSPLFPGKHRAKCLTSWLIVSGTVTVTQVSTTQTEQECLAVSLLPRQIRDNIMEKWGGKEGGTGWGK